MTSRPARPPSMPDSFAASLLRQMLRDLPRFECRDFHHTKEDQHDYASSCPPHTRFDHAVKKATAYLNALDTNPKKKAKLKKEKA